MKKNNLFILLGVLILIIVLLLVYLGTKEEKPFNQVQLNTQVNSVTNVTEYEYYDTIIHVGLQELGLEGIDIRVSPLSETARQNFQSAGGDLYAHIRESDGKYFLFILPTSKSQSITIIAHELIHLTQYHSKKLTYSDGVVTWEGRPYGVDEVSYNIRPWEEEAFQLEGELSNKISNILYQ